MNRLNIYWHYLVTLLVYKFQIRHIGKRSIIFNPLQIDGGSNIVIGYHSQISYKTWLAALPLTGEKCQLKIGNGCIIGHFNHIYATSSITIEDNVLTADKVYISDNIHGYEDISTPILSQPIIQKKPVTIGEGSWIGENACVIGCKIGKHCVIGANAVVTHDIPDYSVAAGIPAKIIKRYDFEVGKWIQAD